MTACYLKSYTQQKSCNFTTENVGATMSGIVMIRSGYEYDLQAAVASVGPVAAAVDATTTGFRVNTHTHTHTFTPLHIYV